MVYCVFVGLFWVGSLLNVGRNLFWFMMVVFSFCVILSLLLVDVGLVVEIRGFELSFLKSFGFVV